MSRKESSRTRRAVCFYDLPEELDKTMFRYELEFFGAIQRLSFPEVNGEWDKTAYVGFLYEQDGEKLLCQSPHIKFCGVQLKARWGYFSNE